MNDDLNFAIKAFILLGIERVLYFYWYTFPTHFKQSARHGVFGPRIKAEPLFWKCAFELGMYVKIFQFSTVMYDLVFRCGVKEWMETSLLPQFMSALSAWMGDESSIN